MSARNKPDRPKRTSTLRDDLSRRTVVSGIGAVAIGTMPALSRASRAAALPAFDDDGLQFVLLRPQSMLPDIVLFRLEGGVRHLRPLKGKPILLNFWASWCALCRTELPMLDALQKTHGSDLSVLAISVDRDEPIKLERFAKSLHLS
jgi:thiol-disulfide isomerase/thioredoxin